MEYLHTMVRVSDLDASLGFHVNILGMVETNRIENEGGRFTDLPPETSLVLT